MSTGPNCPAGMIQHNIFHNLYLAAEGMRFPQVTDDADITTYVNGRDDYVLFEAENLVMKQKKLLQGTLCRNRMEEHGQQIIRVKGNQFIKANGDSVEHFICVRRSGKIKGAPEHCYEEIPLEDDTFIKDIESASNKTCQCNPLQQPLRTQGPNLRRCMDRDR